MATPTTAPQSCRLTIEDLVKTYPGGTTAVAGVSVDMQAGEVLALLGPSGCGKTTLLQAVAGFVVPDRGDIRLDGSSILSTPPERRRTAMVFQHYALFPHMSVRENVAFGLRMMRVPKPEIARRVDAALALVRIAALAERRPAQLSGGQKQRVALARAVITEPRMLLLDEPLGALDQNLREEMQVEIRKLQQRLGLTTLMVTHDQREAIVLADRIAVMQAGRIAQVGTARAIYDRPATRSVARFTGVENLLPARRAAPGVAEVRGLRLEGVHDAAEAGAEVVLAVRSEAVALVPHGTDHALPGTVTFAQMLGASMRYEVDLGGGVSVVVTEMHRDATPRAAGDPVSVAFAAHRCSLLSE